MDYLSPINSNKDLVTKEYVDGIQSIIPSNPQIPLTSGVLYDNAYLGTTTNTFNSPLNTWIFTPIIFPSDVSIDRLGIYRTTDIANFRHKVSISDSTHSSKLPTTRIFESSETASASIGLYLATVSHTFLKNTLYWLGLTTNAGAAGGYRGVTNSINLGVNSSGIKITSYSYSLAFASLLPSDLTGLTTSNTAFSSPYFIFRIA